MSWSDIISWILSYFLAFTAHHIIIKYKLLVIDFIIMVGKDNNPFVGLEILTGLPLNFYFSILGLPMRHTVSIFKHILMFIQNNNQNQESVWGQ